MTTNHKHYLDLAFKIAEINLGKTSTNPSVGTIIVKNNSVISTGLTSQKGRPHAEYNALINRKNVNGSNLYSTLEPCTHQGLTPPCVNLISQKKIKNVYFSFNDPDKRTYKKAISFLKKKGINSKLIENRDYKDFYDSYFFNKKYELPFIGSKIAISKDFYSINKISKHITGFRSKKVTFYLRSTYDCIFSTSKTINKDNSQLNCRINGFNKLKPDLFIIDINLKLKKKLSIYKISKNRTIYLITKKENLKKIEFYKKKGFKFILLNSLENKQDFQNLFKKIYKLGYRRVFFETGLTFLNTLIKYNFINLLYIFQSNKLLKENGYNNNTDRFLKKINFKKKINVNLENDTLYEIKF